MNLNSYVPVKQNHVVFYSEMTTCFGVKRLSSGLHYRNSKIRHRAVQIVLVMWDPVWLAKLIWNCIKIIQYKPRKWTFSKLILYFLVIKPARCTNFSNLFWNETQHISDSSSIHHQELFHPHPARKPSTNLYDIPLLSVQWITPDDGQRNCPKHVEFHFKINLRN
jgi:hypothetical protein